MKEQIHTIPISDAMANAGECPFCYIQRKTEEHAMNYVLGPGASYMEADIRDMTDKEGFCQDHLRKMYIYGNALGNAWIMKTLSKRHLEEMDKEFKNFRPGAAPRKSFFGKKNSAEDSANSIVNWIKRRESTCFTCTMIKNTFNAYMKTFFNMYKSDPDFKKKIAETNGFCLDHFKVLCETADQTLSSKDLEEFYNIVLPLMKKNMERTYEDVSWFIEKYNNNPAADDKNYVGSIQRAMQRLRGQDPSQEDIKMKK